MENNAKVEFSTEVSPTGDWEVSFSDYLGSGLHNLVVTDEFGGEDNMLLFTQDSRANFLTETEEEAAEVQATVVYEVETITEVVPLGFLIASLVVALSLLAYAISNYFAAKRIKKKFTGVKTKLPTAMMSGAVLISIMILAVGAYIGLRSGAAENLAGKIFTPAEEKVAVVVATRVGAVKDPLTLEPVSGVELSAGEVTVRTDTGGQFVFQSLASTDSIRINHAQLQRTVAISSNVENGVDIFFNPGLYNALISVADSQARGEYSRIHASLETTNRNAVSLEDLTQTFSKIYDSADTEYRILMISSIERLSEITLKKSNKIYRNGVRITVAHEEKTEVYDFVVEDAGWRLIRE